MKRVPKDTGRPYLYLLHFVYDSVYIAVLIVAAPFLLFKLFTSRKHRAGLPQRFGVLGNWPDRGPRIWIHGVSVGEILAAKSLVAVIQEELPDHEVVLSTTTKTGQEAARKQYPGCRVFYFPVDFSMVARHVLRRVRPVAVILMELEIWPNFLLATSETQVPVLLVNGRITDHSFRRYRILQRVIPEPMDRIMLYCVQTETYAERFRSLDVPADRVAVTGTMKFDTISTDGTARVRRERKAELSIADGDRVLMGGSTHPTEEETLYRIYGRLREKHPEYRFVLVPRHPERLDEVEAMLVRRGATVVRKTKLGEEPPDRDAVILVDTMGELAELYAVADLVFVGGSLIPHGGQNMMDPAGHGRPVIFGPHIGNFQESVDILLDAGAAVMVDDAAGLEAQVLELADDPEQAERLGAKAREVVIDQKGASRRTMDLIRPWFTDPVGNETTMRSRQ
ncbi:MAG: 3-deoxy-D-manno-octulosonic acid transferase [Planctomycetota bacterium]